MAYFALQVMTGRELIVKNALTIAIRNQKRTDVLEIVVPSQTVLDLTDVAKQKSKAKTVVALPSYVFIRTESDSTSYQKIDGELYNFLQMIPNVHKIITDSIVEDEMNNFLSFWDNCEVVTFSLELEMNDNTSDLMKALEVVKRNKVVTTFRRFVQSIGCKQNKGFEKFNLLLNEGRAIVTVPFDLIRKLLESIPFTLGDLIVAPHNMLEKLNKQCECYGN